MNHGEIPPSSTRSSPCRSVAGTLPARLETPSCSSTAPRSAPLALSRYLGFTAPPRLIREIASIQATGTYAKTAFFIRNQGSVEATPARRIGFEESLVFERLHEQTYRDLGYRLIDVPADPLRDRVALIQRTVDHLAAGGL